MVLIAAYAENRVIGRDGEIPWHLPGDLAHFKAVTMGHTLVMGRSTYDSIGRPLPGRETIVVTRNPDWAADGVRVAHSIEDALAVAAGLPGEVMVAGGGEIYALTMPHATHQVLTLVPGTPDGDASYPEFEETEWVETRCEELDDCTRVWLERRTPPAEAGP